VTTKQPQPGEWFRPRHINRGRHHQLEPRVIGAWHLATDRHEAFRGRAWHHARCGRRIATWDVYLDGLPVYDFLTATEAPEGACGLCLRLSGATGEKLRAIWGRELDAGSGWARNEKVALDALRLLVQRGVIGA